MATRFEGDIFVNDITDYINSTRLNTSLPRDLRILTDSRNSNMLIKPEEVQLIVEANNKSLEVYTYIIDAIILENPHDIAISYLFQELSKASNYFFKLFSTYDAAFEWLTTLKPNL